MRRFARDIKRKISYICVIAHLRSEIVDKLLSTLDNGEKCQMINEGGFSSNPIMDQSILLLDARHLNSDLGRHVRKCSFSSGLTGRFYQNSSMALRSANEKRILKMKARQKELINSLKLENEKLLYLQNRLSEKEERCHEASLMRKQAIRIQSEIRRFFAKQRVDKLLLERQLINRIAIFLQSRFRGNNDRRHAKNVRSKMIQHRKEQLAAIKMQTLVRLSAAKSELNFRIKERLQLQNDTACIIQSYTREWMCRMVARKKQNVLNDHAAIILQSRFRGRKGRSIADAERRKKSKKKLEVKDIRVPLSERRYSTYSIRCRKENELKSMRRFSDTIVRTNMLTNRRSSLSELEFLQKEETIICPHDNSNPIEDDKQSPKNPFKHSLTGKEYNEKTEIARLKAAARVAKLGRQAKREIEKKLTNAEAVKIGLKKLESTRKKLLLRENIKKNDTIN